MQEEKLEEKEQNKLVPNTDTNLNRNSHYTEELKVHDLKHALPRHLKGSADQELVDKINNLTKDDVLREQYRENIVGYAHVLKDGKFKMDSYIDAIKYITHKLMGKTNIDAYRATFPDRYTNFLANGVSLKDINSYVTSYNKNKLVNLIREQTLIPTHILNADYYQKAINKQVQLMDDPNVSPTVQQKAADSLLVNLKAPEDTVVELNINNKANSITDELRETLIQLAAKQKELIAQGISKPREIAESKINIIEGEVEDV